MFAQTSLQHLMALLPKPPARTQDHALTALCWGIAAMAFVSLNPYFLWAYQKPAYALASLMLMAAFPFCWQKLSFSNPRIGLMLGFSLFFVYLSLLPKIDGGHTRWFLLIPFTISLLALRRTTLEKAFGIFYWVFVASLIPGMLLWIWTAAGLPIEFVWMTPPSEIVQRGVIEYFMIPGAVVLPSNAQILPHGGIVFRLCGVYDEPGTVGTIAALFLAASRFRLRDPRGAIAFTAGLMSCSIAFAILAAVGMVLTAVTERRWKILPAALLAATVGGIVTGLIPLKYEIEGKPDITIIDNQSGGPAPEIKSGTELGYYGLGKDARLRFSPVLDNRAQPKMRDLLDSYLDAPLGTLLFGLTSDASTRTGGSSVWYMIFTNFGAVGFAWLFLLFFAPVVIRWRAGNLSAAAMIFCLLFLMSFYQRPAIWLPAQLLIYIAGIFCFRINTKTTRQEPAARTH